jgi:hypothetical protein
MQATKEPFVVIDAKPNQQNKTELLDVIAELRSIIKEALETIG